MSDQHSLPKEVIAVALCALLLPGCTRSLNAWEFEAAKEACKPFGGVGWARSYSTINYGFFAACADGTEVRRLMEKPSGESHDRR